MSESRRDFLRNASMAAIAYTFVDSGPHLRAAGPNDQVGLGFIGVGIRGTGLLGMFKAIPGARPIIAADLYDGHLEHAKEVTDGAIETTKDYHTVLDRKDVDAVVIATPDHWHTQMVLDALDARKDVYIEKPMTWSIPQGQKITAAVKRTQRILQVGSDVKTSAATAQAKEIVKSGMLGKVNMIKMARHRNTPEGAWQYPIPEDASEKTIDWARFQGPAPKRPFDAKVFFRWRGWWEYSGGVATDLFVHLLTTLHEIMDVQAPTAVVSHGGIYKWNDGRTVPDILNSIFEYPGFIVDMYVNLANSRSVHPPVLCGTQGTLVLGGGQELVVYPEPYAPPIQVYGAGALSKAMREKYYESVGYTADGEPKEPLPEPVKEKTISVPRGPSHQEFFIMSVRDRTPSKESAEEGHYAAAAAHLANLSYRSGKRVTWDPTTGRVRLT